MPDMAPTDANRLVAEALTEAATWQAFPGFVADLEIACNGKVSQGRVVVERDGRVFVELVPELHRVWAVQRLDCVVRQRIPHEDVCRKPWIFVGQDAALGHSVCRADQPFGPCHWIQNQQFRAVEVRFAKSKQRLTVFKSERNPDNKYLPVVLVSHRWNTRTSGLEATETTLLSWQRVGAFDLPATLQVLAAEAATDPASGRIVLTRHRLFSSPEALVASR